MHPDSVEYCEAKTLPIHKQDQRLPRVGQTIGRYQILEELGTGGFGAVFKAFDVRLERRVALKFPLASATNGGSVSRILKEARIAAPLRHKNIVQIIEVEEINHFATIVYQLIEGETLGQWIVKNRPEPNRAAHIMLKIVRAIQYAHQQGVLHRDLKPGNILVDDTNEPYVSDFGLAIPTDSLGPNTDNPDNRQLRYGTPSYMAPELTHKDNPQVDERSDIYSLGNIFYELLSGERPFSGQREELVEKIKQGRYQRLENRNRAIPPALIRICERAMEVDPADRYAAAEAFADDLESYLAACVQNATPMAAVTAHSSRQRQWSLFAGTAFAMGLVFLLASIAWQLQKAGFSTDSTLGKLIPVIDDGNHPYSGQADGAFVGKAPESVPERAVSLESVGLDWLDQDEYYPVQFQVTDERGENALADVQSIQLEHLVYDPNFHGLYTPQPVTVEFNERYINLNLEPGRYRITIDHRKWGRTVVFRSVPNQSMLSVKRRLKCRAYQALEDGTIELASIALRRRNANPSGELVLDGGIRLKPISGSKFMLHEPDMHRTRTGLQIEPRWVDIPDFYMGETEVTLRQWQAVMGELPPRFQGRDDLDLDLPVTWINHWEILEFCEKIGARLPTWGEYVYVATNRRETVYPWGNDPRFVGKNWELYPTTISHYDVSLRDGIRGLYSSAAERVDAQWFLGCRKGRFARVFEEQLNSQLIVGHATAFDKGYTLPKSDFGTASLFFAMRFDEKDPQLGFRVVVDRDTTRIASNVKSSASAKPAEEPVDR